MVNLLNMRRAAAQTLVLLRRGQSGAVAQLGERYNGIVEVVSSILIGSTIQNPLPLATGFVVLG
jgi:hypothetical protein